MGAWYHFLSLSRRGLVSVVLRSGIIGTTDLADYADISAALRKQILDVFIRFHQREDEAKKED